MKTEEILFWGVIIVTAIIFIIIFGMLLKEFNKLMQKSKTYAGFLKNSKTLCHATPKQHNTVFVTIIAGSDISVALTEMKTLSELIRMPVCTEFDKKTLRITSQTDINKMLEYFQENTNCKRVKRK